MGWSHGTKREAIGEKRRYTRGYLSGTRIVGIFSVKGANTSAGWVPKNPLPWKGDFWDPSRTRLVPLVSRIMVQKAEPSASEI